MMIVADVVVDTATNNFSVINYVTLNRIL